ncbi:ABC transporter ATP-binding protein [Bosea sp. TWI1241]|uniref:ABC transporter ATP-binding protein n=1 Tax=Bosea sp. TWI1241 TaxID=3148904 RepID=UPI0032093F37
MAIVARTIGVDLAGRRVLDAVDATLARGEVLGIVGPNGAGKSTLLRVLAGVLAPDVGELRVDGETRAQLGAKALARRVAFLAQEGQAAWSLSAGALVGLGRLPHRRPFAAESEADRAAIAEAMRRCDVSGFAARPVGTLSGGERRRVLLARALAVEAFYLLADEPLAGLDPGHQLDTLRLLRAIAAAGTGVAVVLHDLSLAARFCDRLLLIHQGRGVADGPPEAVLDETRLAEIFGVVALRGLHAGTPFLLPWQTTARRGSDDDRR